jgi:hypothetical protein
VQKVWTALLALVGLLFLGIGLNFMFNPVTMGAEFGLAPDGVVGLNTIRGDLGGLFLAMSMMVAAGLATGQRLWFLAVAVLIGSIALGRLLGFVIDGVAGNSLPAFLVELVLLAILVLAHRRPRAP